MLSSGVEWITQPEQMHAPLMDLAALPPVQPKAVSRNLPPILSPLTLPELCLLYQSTQKEGQGAEASDKQGDRIAKSPLQRSLTLQIMSQWSKHVGALDHIGLKRSVEMLELQRAQRFPASSTDPDTSVFAEFLPASQPPEAPLEKEKRWLLNWNSLAFLADLSTQRISTRFPPVVWQAFFCRSLEAPISKMLAHT